MIFCILARSAFLQYLRSNRRKASISLLVYLKGIDKRRTTRSNSYEDLMSSMSAIKLEIQSFFPGFILSSSYEKWSQQELKLGSTIPDLDFGLCSGLSKLRVEDLTSTLPLLLLQA